MPPERDPLENFERLRREIDELYGDVFERSGLAPKRGFSPRVDVYYLDDPPRAVVKAELAGVAMEEVEIQLDGRELVIAGRRGARDTAGRVYQHVEIDQGPFRRVVELGADVVPEETTATYRDGILTVELAIARHRPEVRRVPIQHTRELP